MADENLITDDDWAAAMQEQAATEAGDSEVDRVAAGLAAAAMGKAFELDPSNTVRLLQLAQLELEAGKTEQSGAHFVAMDLGHKRPQFGLAGRWLQVGETGAMHENPRVDDRVFVHIFPRIARAKG